MSRLPRRTHASAAVMPRRVARDHDGSYHVYAIRHILPHAAAIALPLFHVIE